MPDLTDVSLRPMEASDLPLFFLHQLDREAIRMAAFTSKDPGDRDAFMKHWETNMAKKNGLMRTVLVSGKVAGYVLKYVDEERAEVSYWLDREYWGRGIATEALRQLLAELTERPLYARVAEGNVASLRVLQKCGFVVTGRGHGFANGRNAETEEDILTLF